MLHLDIYEVKYLIAVLNERKTETIHEHEFVGELLGKLHNVEPLSFEEFCNTDEYGFMLDAHECSAEAYAAYVEGFNSLK